jgi:hypothetical protein
MSSSFRDARPWAWVERSSVGCTGPATAAPAWPSRLLRIVVGFLAAPRPT